MERPGLPRPIFSVWRPDTSAQPAVLDECTGGVVVTPGITVITAPRAHGRVRDTRGAVHPGPAKWAVIPGVRHGAAVH